MRCFKILQYSAIVVGHFMFLWSDAERALKCFFLSFFPSIIFMCHLYHSLITFFFHPTGLLHMMNTYYIIPIFTTSTPYKDLAYLILFTVFFSLFYAYILVSYQGFNPIELQAHQMGYFLSSWFCPKVLAQFLTCVSL